MFENKIVENFLNNHKQTDDSVTTFVELVKSQGNNITEEYNKIRNALQRHFDSEEMMFSTYEPQEGDIVEILKKIRFQHKEIIRLLDICYDSNFDESCFETLQEFYNMLEEHIDIENSTVYPYFDAEITKNPSSQLIDDLSMYDN